MNIKFKIVPLTFLIALSTLPSCSKKDERVVIYTALEDYRISLFQEELDKKFPTYDIVFQSLSSGNLVSRLQIEGNDTVADIVLNLELCNAEMLISKNKLLFENLSDYDTSKYLDDILSYQERHHYYHIQDREAGCIILNNKVLKEKGLEKPTCYNDLLKPEYKNLVIMPNPKSSGTGYYFYKNIMNTLGYENGLKYFDGLSKNIKEYTTSGSGPVKSLDRGDAAIGLGMTFQAAKYISANDDLEIMYFNEGSPFNYFAMGVINGRLEKPEVKEVYDYIFNYVNYLDKAKFAPDQIYKDEYQPEIELVNFPTNVKYADMGDLYDFKLKQDLLDKWKW